MATELRLRGGTTAQHASFTGATKEITVDTTKNTVVVHDGSTAGGVPLATENELTSEVNSSVHAPGTGLPNEAGTAYSRDVTTSNTDTTAGRLLKVGDFGVGRTATGAASTSNIDNINATQFIQCSFVAEGTFPSTGSDGSVILHQQWADSQAASQTYHKNNRSFVRYKWSGTWTPWREIYHTGNEQQIGVNQAWQDVTSSRSFNVAYTNTTGKPIEVIVSAAGTGSGTTSINGYVNGVLIGTQSSSWSSSGAGTTSNFNMIVPSGAEYYITISGSASISLQRWSELR